MNTLLYMVVVVIWGTTWLAIGLQQGEAAVTVAIFWRFLLASVTLLLVLRILGKLQRLGWRDQGYCLLQGCCVFGFNFVCFYQAAAWMPAGLESVIFSMAVLFNALNNWLCFHQRPPRRLLPASLLGLCGMLALFWPTLTASQLNGGWLIGIGLSLLGTWGFSLGNMLSQRHQRHGLDVLSTNGWAMAWGCAVMGLLSLIRGEDFLPAVSLRWLGALLWLAIPGSVIAFGAYFSLLGRIGAARAAYSTLLFPLVALGLSTLWEGYVWHRHAVLGLGLILLGNLVMFYRPATSRTAAGAAAQ
ncbi:DMT family transporter [Pantoea sp. 1.19]|uniref:DMT family transporter n=1 Tax=Pantoea sp. 1.19 TaxID=1925589 RepID=UPI000948F562|nr:DMT family transporter [Pantoea sp. 1.19]